MNIEQRYPQGRMSKWAYSIYLHSVQTGEALTLPEIEQRFGPAPTCNQSSLQQLEYGIKCGSFRKAGNKYYAVDREDAYTPEPFKKDLFKGIKRVASVWELGL